MAANVQVIRGSDYALRHDGAGYDPVDSTYSDAWCSVMRRVGGEYQPARRFAHRHDAMAYVQAQVRAGQRRREAEQEIR